MASLPRGMQHIDRHELFTSLPARISYLHQFLEFGPEDVEALISGQKYIKMVIPAIVNLVYKKLLKHDITARVFSNRDSRLEADPDTWVTEDSTAIQNRKMFLRWYLTKLNSDPTKMEYWEYLDKVGLMHVGKGRRNPLHVDYIFLGACLGYIQDAITESILSHPRLSLQRKIAVVRAIGKVIWIQNDLLARWHLRDGDEYLDHEDEDELGELCDAEGYLNGKRYLGGGTSSGGSSETSSLRTNGSGRTSIGRSVEEAEEGTQMRCPFSGLAMNEQRAQITRPALKEMLDESRQGTPPVWPSSGGAPRLHLVDGKIVGKDNLDTNFFIGDAL